MHGEQRRSHFCSQSVTTPKFNADRRLPSCSHTAQIRERDTEQKNNHNTLLVDGIDYVSRKRMNPVELTRSHQVTTKLTTGPRETMNPNDCWRFALKAIRQGKSHELVLAQLFDCGLDGKRAERYVRSAMVKVQRALLDSRQARAR
jgi:hypothetical protein